MAGRLHNVDVPLNRTRIDPDEGREYTFGVAVAARECIGNCARGNNNPSCTMKLVCGTIFQLFASRRFTGIGPCNSTPRFSMHDFRCSMIDRGYIFLRDVPEEVIAMMKRELRWLRDYYLRNLPVSSNNQTRAYGYVLKILSCTRAVT